MFPICGAFSIVSKATVLKFVWLISIHRYNGLGIFDSEICNKRCFFLTKERLFLWLLFFWLSYISSDNKYWAGFFFIMEYECRYCFFTALLAVSCALFLWCCPRGYPGGEEPVWEMMSVRLSFVWALSFKASTTRLTSSLFWSPIFVMSMVM